MEMNNCLEFHVQETSLVSQMHCSFLFIYIINITNIMTVTSYIICASVHGSKQVIHVFVHY